MSEAPALKKRKPNDSRLHLERCGVQRQMCSSERGVGVGAFLRKEMGESVFMKFRRGGVEKGRRKNL